MSTVNETQLNIFVDVVCVFQSNVFEFEFNDRIVSGHDWVHRVATCPRTSIFFSVLCFKLFLHRLRRCNFCHRVVNCQRWEKSFYIFVFLEWWYFHLNSYPFDFIHAFCFSSSNFALLAILTSSCPKISDFTFAQRLNSLWSLPFKISTAAFATKLIWVWKDFAPNPALAYFGAPK